MAQGRAFSGRQAPFRPAEAKKRCTGFQGVSGPSPRSTLLPHSLEDYVDEENPVRVIEVFIDELDLAALGFSGVTPAATGRPAYHPSTRLKIIGNRISEVFLLRIVRQISKRQHHNRKPAGLH